MGVKPGDEVITQSFTFVATVEAILELGAKPIITEIDKSLNMDPIDLKRKITKKTKTIIPVHMSGVSARMKEIMEISNEENIPVLEDSAQSFGGSYKNKFLGTIGDAGIYSLDIGKIITTGEGGVLVTDKEEIYQKAREYSDHGHEQNPNFPRGEDTRHHWGFNYKMMELQGAIGLAQLKKLDYIIKKQRDNKKQMKKIIETIKNIEFRDVPDVKGDTGDTLIFFVKLEEKAKRIAKILDNNIGTKNLPDAIDWHFAGTWKHIFDYNNLNNIWKNSNDLLRKSIAIPICINMDYQIKDVIESLKNITKN